MDPVKIDVDDTAGGTTVVAGRTGRKMLFIRNMGPDTVYLSDGTPTAAASWPLLINEVLPMPREGAGGMDISFPVKAICDTGDEAELRVWETA